MDYKPLSEYLTSGVLKKDGLSKSTVKRILRETNFLAALPQDLGRERINCGHILELCRQAAAVPVRADISTSCAIVRLSGMYNFRGCKEM